VSWALKLGSLPGRHYWQIPGLADGRPPWPPRCPSSGHTLTPTRGTHFSQSAPPLGPRRGCGPHSGAAVNKKGTVTRREGSSLLCCHHPQLPQQARCLCLATHEYPGILKNLLCSSIAPAQLYSEVSTCISWNPTPPSQAS
jgi:hypothetical protein